MADDILRLTPSQAIAFTDEVMAVRQRYLDTPPAPHAGETTELVSLYLHLLPFERIEDLEG
jgi:hypothetical protein